MLFSLFFYKISCAPRIYSNLNITFIDMKKIILFFTALTGMTVRSAWI